jgi:hypothetical protein
MDLLYRIFRHDFQVFRLMERRALSNSETEGEMAVIISDPRMHPRMGSAEFFIRMVEPFPDTFASSLLATRMLRLVELLTQVSF